MSIKQLSIFAENKIGSVCEITGILLESGINIRAFSVADTQSYGVLRLIVDDPRGAAFKLSEAGKILHVTNVIGVMIPDREGGLNAVLEILSEENISVEYLYACLAPTAGHAYVVLRVSDNDATEKILRSRGVTLLTDEDLHK